MGTTGLGSSILFSYPQLATLAGLQGVIVYAISSSAPLFMFAALTPIIRSKCPEGFVLTEWTRQRYGTITGLYLGACVLLTLFLYMVSELSAIGQVVNALTGLDILPVVIVECVITTIYTCEPPPPGALSPVYPTLFASVRLDRLETDPELRSTRRIQDFIPYR